MSIRSRRAAGVVYQLIRQLMIREQNRRSKRKTESIACDTIHPTQKACMNRKVSIVLYDTRTQVSVPKYCHETRGEDSQSFRNTSKDDITRQWPHDIVCFDDTPQFISKSDANSRYLGRWYMVNKRMRKSIFVRFNPSCARQAGKAGSQVLIIILTTE